MAQLFKFPRTPHLCGSRLGVGDEDLSQIPFSDILGRHVVIEEKIDGANCGISFDSDGTLLLQNRGHFFYGGYKERHYDLFKSFANQNKAALYSVLGARYVMYGEWMYAKHTVFYDSLPDYFIEFDIYDKEKGVFLDTPSRRAITEALPFKLYSVPVLGSGCYRTRDEVLRHLSVSCYISPSHLDVLASTSQSVGANVDEVMMNTDNTRYMEGLYIKVEENGEVRKRVKFVRSTYVQAAALDTSRWQSRIIIPNQLVKNK
jgi:hypothetical protein